MEVNMAKKDLDLEDLLGLTDKTIQVELDIKQKEPAKGTLEYDLWKLLKLKPKKIKITINDSKPQTVTLNNTDKYLYQIILTKI